MAYGRDEAMAYGRDAIMILLVRDAIMILLVRDTKFVTRDSFCNTPVVRVRQTTRP